MGILAESIRSGGWFGPYGMGDKALVSLFGGQPSSSGVTVNEQTALNISAVWAAVHVLAGPVSTLPLVLYKRQGERGKEPFTEHPVYRLLHDQPNPETTSVVFRETLHQHVLLWGNGYAEIQRDGAGQPFALWIITPDLVEPFRDTGSRLIKYRVRQDDGKQIVMDADRMLHVPGLGWDGVMGYGVIRKARESLGLLAATERFGSSFFGNGAWPGIVAQHPGKLSPEAHKRLKESLTDSLQGPNRAHSLIVTEEGIKIEKAGIPPDDAQFLETRAFQVLEVARWFNVPPHMLRDLSRATFSNIEHQAIEFVVHSLTPWLVKWEKELERKLIRPLERRQQFIKFNVKGLLRGDTLTRYQAHAVARNWGWESANDVRAIEDENPIGPEGDIYLVPTNMTPADRVNEVIDAQVAPKPAAAVPAVPAEPEPERDSRMRYLADLVAERLRPELVDLTAADREIMLARFATVDAANQTARAEAEARDLERVEAERAEAIVATATLQSELYARLDTEKAERKAQAEAQAARIASLVPSLRDVIEGALSKEARFEADRARKAAASPEKFRAWLDTFYATREDALVQFLLPSMRLHFALTGRADDAEPETRRLMQAYVAESRAALEPLLESPATLEADVKALVARWETERPARIADELLREIIANGGAA